MNIALICGCLEPGRDGIGDFTRRVAGQLEKAGASYLLIGWNDFYVKDSDTLIASHVTKELIRTSELRVSSLLASKTKLLKVKPILDKFQPDLVALQYNPYSFHAKGLPFSLPSVFHNLFQSIPVHLMFHELWCDRRLPVTRRAKIYGIAQREIVHHLCSALSPVACLTSNSFYKQMLSEIGVSSTVAPVFSNITVSAFLGNSRQWLVERLSLGGVENPYVFGVFGEQPTHPSKEAVQELRTNVLQTDPKRNLCLAVCGRQTARSLSYARKLANLLGVDVPPIFMDYLDNDLLSRFLYSIDLGISTYPFELSGKSGTLAAFLAHGKAVALVGTNLVAKRGSCNFLLPEKTHSTNSLHSIAEELVRYASIRQDS